MPEKKKRAFEHQNKKCDNLSNVCHLDTKGMVGSQTPSRNKLLTDPMGLAYIGTSPDSQ